MFPDSTDHRCNYRLKLVNTFIVNQEGVCRVFDLSLGGVSFGCSSKTDIPERLVVDIIDDNGLHLLDLPVGRVWSAKNQDFNTSSIYDTVVGVKFDTDLSSDQQSSLNQLLEFLSKNIPQ